MYLIENIREIRSQTFDKYDRTGFGNVAGMFANLSLTENKTRVQMYASVKKIYILVE